MKTILGKNVHKWKALFFAISVALNSVIVAEASGANDGTKGERDEDNIAGTAIAAVKLIGYALRGLTSSDEDGFAEWKAVGQEFDVDPILLYAIALNESGKRWTDGVFRPSPWAIRISGVAYHPRDQREAEALVDDAVRRGLKIEDVGLMQVNFPSHGERVHGDVRLLLNPETNLRVGADILRDALRSDSNRVMAVGHYHSWTPSLAWEYGTAVLATADQLRRNMLQGQ